MKMRWCIVLFTCCGLLEQSGAAPRSKRSADPGPEQRTEPHMEPHTEPHTEPPQEKHESLLSKLLADYDKVKVTSEGSDCGCKCVVRALSRSACRRIQEGHARAQDFYTVETITTGPHCKCVCAAPPSAVNPCEGNAKLSTILDLLEGSFYGMDLLKLHSVTSKLVERMDHIEKMVWMNKSHAEENPQQSLPQIDNVDLPPTHSPHKFQNNKMTHGNLKSAEAEEMFVEESPTVVHSEKFAEAIEMSSKETPKTNQVTKTGPNGLIIRGMTFYKSESDPMVADDGEPGENLFEYDGFSGDGPINLFIEENLLQHKTPRPRTRPAHRTFISMMDHQFTNQKTTEHTQSKETETHKQLPVIPSEKTTTHAPSTTSSMQYSQKSTSKPQLWPVDLTHESHVTKTTVGPVQSSENTATIDSIQGFLTNSTTFAVIKNSTTANPTSVSTNTATAGVPTSSTTPTVKPTSALSTKANKEETPLSTQPLTSVTPGHTPRPSITPGTTSSSATTVTTALFSSTAAETFPVESKLKQEEKIHVRKPADCKDTLATISEPVTQNTFGRSEGAWMKDSKSDSGKIYVTNYFYGNSLLEFASLEVFKQGHFTNSYKLPYHWIGTGHVVYRGAFYYNRAFSRDIIKFDLHHRYVAAWTMLHDAVFEESSSPWEWRSYSDINIAVDESGLWIIYPALDDEGFLQEVVVVSRLNPVDLSMQRETTWRTGLRRNQYGNCFIVCGVLYFVDSYNQRDANLEYAFDTHTNTQMIPRMPFTNNYTYTTQVDYNPKEGVLYAWDNGHQVTYNVKFAFVEP